MNDNDDAHSNILWVSAHPEPLSLNGNLRREAIDHLTHKGHSVVESDLYAMDWDPVVRRVDGGHADFGHSNDEQPPRFRVSADTRDAFLSARQPSEIVREQEKIRRADAVVVQFPLWWYGMPAILKGWFDRVFVSGFAFGADPETGRRLRFEQGPFVGKRALVVTTLGDRPRSIGPRGKSGEITELLFGLLHGTFAYTGMSVLAPMAVPSADHLGGDQQVHSALRHRLDHLFTEEPIPYRPQFTGDYTSDGEAAPHVRPGEYGVRVNIRSSI